MNRRRNDVAASMLTYLGLLAGCAFAVLPLLWFASTSLKAEVEVDAWPPRWIPHNPTLSNYSFILSNPRVWRYFANSLFVSIMAAIVATLAGAMSGYMASRARFRGRELLSIAILGTAMIPGVAIVPGLYRVVASVGLHDTYTALILVFGAWRAPEVMWILRNFYARLPKELDEAAMIDGASPWRIFFSILLPLSQPGIVAAAVIVFIFAWNNWILAMTLTISDHMRLVPVGLYFYIGETGVQWGKFTAYGLLAALPVVALFLVLQTRLIGGLTAGTTKG